MRFRACFRCIIVVARVDRQPTTDLIRSNTQTQTSRLSGRRVLMHCGMLHPRGGLETHVIQAALWLAAEGCQVELFAHSNRLPSDQSDKLRKGGVVITQMAFTE